MKGAREPDELEVFVTDFASRNAASTASAPPEKSWMRVSPAGVTPPRRFRNFARTSVVKLPKVSLAACSWSART